MREGDIYSWRWKSKERDRDCGPFGSYHCYSMLAVVKDGSLCDTYWHDLSRRLDPDAVVLTYLGNAHDMTEIREWDVPYYRRENIVDMRHANNSRGPIYLKPGAVKDAQVMLTYAREKRDEAEREIRSASRQIDRMDDIEKLIQAGRLDEVHF